MEAAGSEAIAIVCDVSSAQQVEKAFGGDSPPFWADRHPRQQRLLNSDNLSFKMSEDDWDKGA